MRFKFQWPNFLNYLTLELRNYSNLSRIQDLETPLINPQFSQLFPVRFLLEISNRIDRKIDATTIRLIVNAKFPFWIFNSSISARVKFRINFIIHDRYITWRREMVRIHSTKCFFFFFFKKETQGKMDFKFFKRTKEGSCRAFVCNSATTDNALVRLITDCNVPIRGRVRPVNFLCSAFR